MGKSSILTIKQDTTVIITEENARLIHLSPAHADYEELDSEGNIIGINYCDEYKINKSGIININKTKYKIQDIKKVKHNGVKPAHYKIATTSTLTKSFNFIVPFLGGNRHTFKFNSHFINAFIGTEKDGDYGDSIYLLYKFIGTVEFTTFEASLIDHPWYVETKDVDQFQVLYKFDIPTEHKKDVNLFLQGKYSSVSVSAKERILTFHGAKETSTLGQILSKSKKRKDFLEKDLVLETPIPSNVDLFDKFKPENEIFRDYLRIDKSKMDE
tara:strand:+ start:17818 stop:18627 length:810 start_codon:yes stop_codon:yes gene_type:complete